MSLKVKRVCPKCRKKFLVFPSQLRKGRSIHCSKSCNGNGVKPVPLEVQFLRHVKKLKNGCWLWIGSMQGPDRDRGQLNVGGKITKATHVSWRIYRGKLPKGKCVLHNCPAGDNPSCVNPDHLWSGTQLQNIADMVAKGRQKGKRVA